MQALVGAVTWATKPAQFKSAGDVGAREIHEGSQTPYRPPAVLVGECFQGILFSRSSSRAWLVLRALSALSSRVPPLAWETQMMEPVLWDDLLKNENLRVTDTAQHQTTCNTIYYLIYQLSSIFLEEASLLQQKKRPSARAG